MHNFIPFVSTEKDCTYLKKFYPDVERVRVGLDSYNDVAKHLPKSKKLWLDTTLDGFCGSQANEHTKPKVTSVIKEAVAEGLLSANSATKDKKPRKLDWIDFIAKFKHSQHLFLPAFLARPDKKIVEEFVFALLNECKKHAPDWLSVPQFPHADDSSRNKINRLLAEATGEWKSASNFSGSLILPAVFCSKSQLASKSSRNTKIKAILDSFEKANADGVWTVDESLTDWDGSESFIRERFPAVIALQSELNSSAKLPSNAIKIAGPYWGLNLLLWSRELIQYPAISLGTGWKYNLSGGMPRTGTPRIMISHLKRPVEAQPEMAAWFASAIAAAGPAIEARNELIALSAKLQNYQFDREEARAQLNGAYKAWLDVICSTPDKGRAVALYQDFSTAYVFGSTLPDLPIEGTGRRPGQVAKTFMLNCLGH